MIPEVILAARWGGCVKDIKGRNTNRYQFATAGNKSICLWKFDPKQGAFEHELINTGSTIREYVCLDFSKNNEDYLYAGNTSGDFCVFQMKNKLLSNIINVCPLGITSIQVISKDIVAVGGGNGTIATFKIEGHLATALYKVSITGAVYSLSYNYDGSQIIAGTDKGLIYTASTADLKTRLQCENHTESVGFLAYPYKVSDKFASCSDDGTIRLWDVSEYTVDSKCVSSGAGIPLSLIYSDEVVIGGWSDGRIRMYKVENGNQLWQIDNAHKGGVTTMCLANNLKFIASGGTEGEVRIWELRSREMISHLKEHTHRVSKVQLLQDDLHLLSASRDKALLCWDLKSEKRVSAHVQRMGGINNFDVVPNSRVVLTTGQDRKITYWDLREPNPVRSIDTNNNPKRADECMGLAIAHDGKTFATGGSEQILRLWDLGSGKVISEGLGHSGTISSIAYSYDDKQIISGGRDGSIFLWNLYM